MLQRYFCIVKTLVLHMRQLEIGNLFICESTCLCAYIIADDLGIFSYREVYAV